jgi:Vacuolar (H+)-ATPase G subunit
MKEKFIKIILIFTGKQKRLKQAKEEAQDEIEKYRQERERQFKEFEAKVSIIAN